MPFIENETFLKKASSGNGRQSDLWRISCMKQIKQGFPSHSLKDICLWEVYTLATGFKWEDIKMQNHRMLRGQNEP